MDAETIRTGLQVVNMLGMFAIGVWLYLEKRNDKTNERVSAQGQKIEAVEQRISSLEATADAAPDHSDLAKVYDAINALAATVNQLVGENRGQSDTLRLILGRITERGMQ